MNICDQTGATLGPPTSRSASSNQPAQAGFAAAAREANAAQAAGGAPQEPAGSHVSRLAASPAATDYHFPHRTLLLAVRDHLRNRKETR
jgi:hypothetical protein